MEVGISAAAARKGSRAVVVPELAEPPPGGLGGIAQRILAMTASATWEVPTALGSSRSCFMS